VSRIGVFKAAAALFSLAAAGNLLQAQPKVGMELAAVMARSGPDERMAVLVRFSEKGISDKASLDRALETRGRQLSARSLRRRAKMGIQGATFDDLPVSGIYVESVLRLGAKHRNTLNWFNAASFEMSKAQIEACAALPFVSCIEPLRSRRPSPAPEEGVPGQFPPAIIPAKSLLSYGPSYRQNLMINAVACHDSGYTGTGTLVAMLDNGFRKNHQAFDSIRASGRLVDEWDYCSGADTTDWAGHGTGTWSLAGAFVPGQLIGPAYGASWAIYHTEDNYQEMPVEEDHWAAALQRADSIGADIVSSSLAYRDFDDPGLSYSYQDLDGNTAISSLAAKHAAILGIVVCNAMGNDGPGMGTLAAPADADSIISVGATDSLGLIDSYSSRGPTYDGRPKPEVCAQGSNTWWARYTGTADYGRATGTSCATPLVAGACALVLEAHPGWTPLQVREALMMTADHAASPDSDSYGWGVIDAWAAIHYDPTGVSTGGNMDVAGAFPAPVCLPNPIRSRAKIAFNLDRAGPALLSVYDAAGRRIFFFRAGWLPRGRNELQWNGCDQADRKVPSGMYFFKIESNGREAVTRAVLFR